MSNINKHSERFTNAVTKLYNDFHKGKLNAFDCEACAVGSICDNSSSWANYYWMTDTSGGVLRQTFFEDKTEKVLHTNYSVEELSNLELIFLNSFELSSKDRNGKDKEQQFKGLCAVVEYLCELEGIPNIMDYTSLFETENNEPKHQLEEVFV
jgi:hypothetical protein